MNIFENAYFGKPYKTRDGRKALYIGEISRDITDNPHRLVLSVIEDIFVMDDGRLSYLKEYSYDIVSEWQESINEENIKRLCVGARALCGVLDENGIDCPEKEFVSNMADNLMSKLIK